MKTFMSQPPIDSKVYVLQKKLDGAWFDLTWRRGGERYQYVPDKGRYREVRIEHYGTSKQKTVVVTVWAVDETPEINDDFL